jgi:hypothetical protein
LRQARLRHPGFEDEAGTDQLDWKLALLVEHSEALDQMQYCLDFPELRSLNLSKGLTANAIRYRFGEA